MLSRKYYNMLAKLISKSESKEEFISSLSHELWEDNPSFDADRFKAACNRHESEV